MSDMSNLYRAYSAVHSSEVSDQLSESRDLISDMQFNQLNSSDLQEVAEEILEEMFELSLDINQSSDIIADILSESLKTSQSDLKAQKIDYIGEAFDAALENGHTVERFLGYRRSKKVQENFHNTSNEDRSSKRLHEALIAQERKNIKEGILSLIEKKTKDSSYLETNMKKRQDNNEKARKDMEKMGTSMKNPQLEEFSQIRKDWSGAYSSIYEKKMDAVGKEDGDIDNDGDKDSSDDYLANRRKAIGKSMGKKGKCEKCGKDPCECDKKEEVQHKEVTFSESELEAIQAKLDAWDVEEFEQLDELSKGTMGSYVKKASKDVEKRSYSQGEVDAEDAEIGYPGQTPKDKKIDKRQKGIGRAVGKMTRKEEFGQLDEISKKLARSYVDKATDDRDKNAKDWKSTSSGEAFNKAERREKNIQRATSKLYKGTPAGKIMGTGNPSKVSATGEDPAEPKEKSKGLKGLVKRITRKEEVTFSESELEAIQAKVDAWDVEEGYQRNPEKGEAQARKSETSSQKTERNVRDRLKTMDPKKAEAMKKQMRAVGLSV